jgi:hypothetical protein
VEALFFLERGMEKSPGRFVVAGLPLGDISWESERNIPQMKTGKTTAACWLLMASISLIAFGRSFAADLDTGRIDDLTGLREDRRGRMDNAAVHGTRNLGRIHSDKRWSDGDGRYCFV